MKKINYSDKIIKIKVKVIKAPLVDSKELKRIILARSKALVLQF